MLKVNVVKGPIYCSSQKSTEDRISPIRPNSPLSSSAFKTPGNIWSKFLSERVRWNFSKYGFGPENSIQYAPMASMLGILWIPEQFVLKTAGAQKYTKSQPHIPSNPFLLHRLLGYDALSIPTQNRQRFRMWGCGGGEWRTCPPAHKPQKNGGLNPSLQIEAHLLSHRTRFSGPEGCASILAWALIWLLTSPQASYILLLLLLFKL